MTKRDTNIEHLHPQFRNRILQLFDRLKKENLPFQLFEGYRSPQRQHSLYAQGRTQSGKKVTNAKPWQSFHQYGIAGDFVLFENGKWSWDTSGHRMAWWDRLHQLGKEVGLSPLTWEKPHLQLAKVHLSELQQGNYPPNGDESWHKHLTETISNWKSSPPPPPFPKIQLTENNKKVLDIQAHAVHHKSDQEHSRQGKHTMVSDDLVYQICGRQYDFFQDDILQHEESLRQTITGSRILVTGGAGSIGSATIQALIPYQPKSLHVVDQNENALAELVRNLRSSSIPFDIDDFKTLPLDIGSPIMERFLLNEPPYDHVLNFAAIKHVRSEKDLFCLLQLLETNVIKTARLLEWISIKEKPFRYFCVSTDKAANPAGFMGVSKRLMEHIIFSHEIATTKLMTTTSARFANVAFSNGSLLESFLKRIEKKQPLAAPQDTRRYFVSLREAGQICLLAAFLAPNRCLMIPRLKPEQDLIELETVARLVLKHHGFETKIYQSEDDAKNNLELDIMEGRYPLLLTPLDTSGEKPFEEFIGEQETASDLGFSSVEGIHYQETVSSLRQVLDQLQDIIQTPNRAATKEELASMIAPYIPEFHHHETGKHLDQRM